MYNKNNKSTYLTVTLSKTQLGLVLLTLLSLSFFTIPQTSLLIDNDWNNGFRHPLHGWDHLLTMIAVGIWAAQIRGAATWLLPLTFVSVMSLGGLAGAANMVLPSVEMMILLSGILFSIFIVRKVQFATKINVLIVAFFAFFHGYVHGQEISASASLISYTLGFVIATLMLHGAGIATARLITLSVAFFVGGTAQARDTEIVTLDTEEATVTTESPAVSKDAIQLEEMVITGEGGRAASQVGIADSASQGSVSQAQLKYRPISRPGEVMETIPGLIATQHSGEGKASQYFLRGFNLDHGTDFLTQIDGVPVNMLSHSHGQGWTDTNFLIPELIESLDFKKGSNYAENGDFSSTGSANIRYFKELPEHILKFSGGSFDYYRGLLAGSHKLGDGNLLYAAESTHNNGPWTVGNDYLKINGMLRYSVERGDHGWSLTAMATQSDWNATDQVPRQAVNSGKIGRFDAVDPTDGGNSQRYSVTGEWHRMDADSETKLLAYGVYSKLNLFSNFTYFLNDPVNGDQFGQPDDRWTTGFKANHTFFHKLGQAESETTLGLQIRNDNIQNALTSTKARKQLGITRQDTIWETSISPYAENKTRWNDWFRSSLGLRFDGFRFDVSNSNLTQNIGERYDGLVSPKLGLVFGPWADTEFYLNGGLGYHSNDARGALTTVDPATGSAVARANPLVRTYSAELGIRSNWVKSLQSTLALWWLDTDSELIFVGDAGTTVASRPGRRYGLELNNFYSPNDWLTFDADVSFSHARFRNTVAGEGNFIPNSVETVIAAGATFHDVYGGFFGGPRLRYLGPRSLNEDGNKRSNSTLLLSATLGYEVNKNLSFQAEVFNILDRKDDGITYFYASRLTPNSQASQDFHFHPVEPVSFRLGFTAKF